MSKQSTSWEASAEWYDALVEGKPGNYQKEVILPNLLRILGLKKDEAVLDLACGQGFFTRAFASAGARVTAADISPSLVALAKEHSPKEVHSAGSGQVSFHVAPAHKLGFAKDASIDTIVIVMAIQNMENPGDVLKECTRVLKPGGRIAIVMNHPAFRIPRRSDWGFDQEKGIQYRRIDGYMSQSKILIDMHPGKKLARPGSAGGGSEQTVSFHNPLQVYFKMFHKHGLLVSRLEEWISHKTSAKGPRQKAEDDSRKEIPMFLCLEVRRVDML